MLIQSVFMNVHPIHHSVYAVVFYRCHQSYLSYQLLLFAIYMIFVLNLFINALSITPTNIHTVSHRVQQLIYLHLFTDFGSGLVLKTEEQPSQNSSVKTNQIN